MSKKKYVLIGTGGRSRLFHEAIFTTYQETSELLALCDLSQTRMDYTNHIIQTVYQKKALPTYLYTEFEQMLDDHKPDFVIVTTIDRTHHDYIIRAMRKGYHVITEKPMTVDEEKAQAIIDCQKETGKQLIVTFNYRYSPGHTKIKEIIQNGVIGEVYSIHFEWLLNIKHGADYYRRWHRNKINSGGLLVHKSTHHFDLVNYWLGSNPKSVFAYGERNFYGKENAEKRGETHFSYRSFGSDLTKDLFAIDMTENETLKGLYLDAEKDSGYLRDRSVFGDDISIEDTMGVLVKYQNKTVLTYSLNSYMPWEGFNIMINGSKGRIEYTTTEKSYINAGGQKVDEGAAIKQQIIVRPLFEKPYNVSFTPGVGGHGGGDNVMLEFIFGKPKRDIFKRAATHIDGTYSILVGVAANKSIASGHEIKMKDLIHF